MANLKEVSTSNAPAAIGPYSQAIETGDLLFISGQIPLNPTTGEMVGQTIEEQTTQVFENLAAILKAKGLSFGNVVKAEVYLADINDFAAVNEIYATRFTEDPKPARQAMQVAALPKNALIEISCIATLK